MKIREIVQEADASRRGFLKGVAGIAAGAAMPSVPAGVVKQVVKDIKPNNIGAVKDLMDRFDIRRLYTIFRTWNDPDMWQPNYMLSQDDQERLFQHYKDDFEKFERDHPPPPRGVEPRPADWDEEQDGPWEPWGEYQPFGDRRRNPDNYVLYRILLDNASMLGISGDEIGRMFEADNDDGFEKAFEIYVNNWPKLVPYIERIIGRRTDISDAIEILKKNGIKDPTKFATNEELWEVLEKLYSQSFHGSPWPEGWPSFEEMMKRDNFSVTIKGDTVRASSLAAEPPKNGNQLRSLLQSAMQAAMSLMRKGENPAKPKIDLPTDLRISVNKPDADVDAKGTPAALPTPQPGIDIGLGAKEKDRVKR